MLVKITPAVPELYPEGMDGVVAERLDLASLVSRDDNCYFRALSSYLCGPGCDLCRCLGNNPKLIIKKMRGSS